MTPKTLVLIPTRSELKIIDPYLDHFDSVETRLCGFGLVEATINTYREAQLSKPNSILLCGVAGTYDPNVCAVGKTYSFGQVSQFGIGCQRESFQLPSDLGFGSGMETLTLQALDESNELQHLVSVTSSGTFSPEQIRSAYPGAMAEDMEGYGYTLGAIACGVPHISIVRSISNVVGEPFSEWLINEALHQLGQNLQSHFDALTT